jgi:predicted transcriptional regulator
MLLPKGIDFTKTDRKACDHCGGKGWLPTPESLRKKREKAKLTLTTVAKRMGVTKSRLSSLERGHWEWDADKVANFLEAIADLKKRQVAAKSFQGLPTL